MALYQQTSHLRLSLSEINMEVYINNNWEDFDHKFGIEMISFINHQSHPAHQSRRLTVLITIS